MAAGEIRAGKAFVEIGGKDQLTALMNKIGAKFKAFGSVVTSAGKGLSVVGAAITGPLIAAAKTSADSGAKLFDMSKRTGIAADQLSMYGFAADATGSSLETFEGAIRRMQKTLSGSKDELEGTTGNLDDLHLAMADLKGLSPDQQFEKIAAAIGEIKDPSTRAAAAMKVFGRSGTELLPMIEKLGELQGQAKKFGFVRSDADIAQAKGMEEAWSLVEKAATSLWNTLGSAVMPILREKAALVFRITLQLRDWAAQNKSTVATIFQIGLAASAAGASLLIAGKAIGAITPLTRAAAGGMKLLSMALGGAGVLGPLLAIGAVLAGLGVYWAFFTDSGKAALNFISDQFIDLKKDAGIAFAGIADALKAGDIKLAGQIAVTELEILWVEFKAFMKDIWKAVVGNMQETFLKGIAAMKIAWETFKGFIATNAVSLVDQDKVDSAQNNVNALQDELNGKKRRTYHGPAALGMYTESEARDPKIVRKELDEARKVLNDTMKGFGKDQQAESDKIKAAIAAAVKERDDAIAKLQKEEVGGATADTKDLSDKVADLEAKLKDLREKAGKESQSPSGSNNQYQLPPPPAPLDAAGAAKLAGGVNDVGKLTAGTFNVASLRGLAGGGSEMQKRIANATEKTAINTQNLVAAIAAGATSLVFGI